MNKLICVACLLASVWAACIGNPVLADTIVLCPTAVTATGTADHPFDATINNSGLSSAVDSGPAPLPGSWPTGGFMDVSQGVGSDYMGRFSGDGSGDSLVYTLPTSIPGYTAPTITKIELWQYDEIWNSGYFNDRGIASTTVYYSLGADNSWSATGQVVTFTQAPSQSTINVQERTLDLPTGVDAIKFDAITGFGGGYVGFNEVRFVGTASAIPEPSALVLLAVGLIGLLAYAWRKRR